MDEDDVNNRSAAFDYESSSSREITPTVVDTTMSGNQNQDTSAARGSTSYSSAARSVPKSVTPKKDQAIIFHAEDHLKLFDYVKAIGEIVGPKNVTFASRISNNRICIYLASSKLVDQLVASHPRVPVGDMQLFIRRLISPTKRILISNIDPSIPHELAEEALRTLGLHLASPVSYLKASMPSSDYGHLLSFRRQVYIFSPTDDYELQTSVLIPSDGRLCRVFLSSDKMECFVCKQPGHIANNCPNPPRTTIPLPPKGPSQSPDQEDATIDNSTTREDTTSDLEPATAQKRCLSGTLTLSGETSRSDQVSPDHVTMPPPAHPSTEKSAKQPRKKRKTHSTSEAAISEATRTAIKELYERKPEDFTIPLNSFLAFVENTYDNNKPYQEALKYTSDIKSLVSSMHTIYPVLNERSLKNRFTRLSKRLKAELTSEELESMSVSSLRSRSSLELSDEDVYSDTSQRSLHSSY